VRRSLIHVLGLILVLAGGSLAQAADANLPRYNLPLGRSLTYTITSQSKPIDPGAGAGAGAGGETSSVGTWRLTVVRENPDGSRRVIVRSDTTFTQIIEGQKIMTPPQSSLAYADVFPDGRVPQNKSLGMFVDISPIVPLLPADEARAAKGWTRENPEKLETMTYAADAKANAGAGGRDEFVFTAEQSGLMSKIFATTEKTTYHFDRGKGAIVSAAGEISQNYGLKGKGTQSVKLDADQTLPADEVAQLAADYEMFFDAKQTYRRKLQSIDANPDNGPALIADAKAAVERARAAAKTDPVKAELDRILKGHDENVQSAMSGVDGIKQILNKPAPDFAASDIDGKPVKLSDFRGKIVVLDFWYRACPQCMYETPQVKQLAEDFAGKNVVVLGMNTDEDEKDARFVIDAMGMKYTTVKTSAAVTDKYGVQIYPTVVVIDKEGIVREVHTGFTPTLHEDVSNKIRAMN
jgi:peroxiredoxin